MSTPPAPGTPIAHCTHPRAHHVHGTPTAYKYCKCRCDTCRRVVARRANLYRADTERNGPRLVDAQPVREHLQQLRDAGMSAAQIVAAIGMARRHYHQIVTGEYTTVTRTTRDRVLATTPTTPDPRDGDPLINQRSTLRRIHALHAIGWTASNIAHAANTTQATITNLTCTPRKYVRRSFANAITDAYDQLAWTTPPESPWATAARNRAARRGWAPPAAWDDIDHDTTPQPWQATTPTGQGNRPHTWHIDDVQHFADLGMDRNETARRLGIQPETLRDKLPTLGHPELLEQLDRNATSRAA